MKDYYKINALAENLRRKWGIDNYSPIDIFSIAIEKINNLTLLWMPLGDKISGASSKSEKDLFVIINSQDSKGRQNFTLAHELYHLLFEDDDKWIVCSNHDYKNKKNDSEESEKKANQFASSLLMPDCALDDFKEKNNIKEWTLTDIIKCEQFFKISHVNMLCRLRRENLISKEDFKEFRDNIKIEAMKRGFSTDLYDPSDEKKKYYALGCCIPLIEKVCNNDKISKGKKEELLLDLFRPDIIYNLNESG